MEVSMNTELTICPFCGDPGILTIDPGDMSVGIGEFYWSGCDKCAYSIPFRNKDNAVKWWNTRPLESSLLLNLKELGDAMGDFDTEITRLRKNLEHLLRKAIQHEISGARY